MIVPVNFTWVQGIDFSLCCRVWTQDKSGAQRRMKNKAVLVNLAQSINHLAARAARPVFAQAQDPANVETTGTDAYNLYEWKYLDAVDNGIDRVVRIVALPRRSGSGNSYAITETGDESGRFVRTVASPSFPSDLFYCEFWAHRGTVTDAALLDAIRTKNGFTIVDVMVQDVPLDSLDTTKHLYSNPSLAISGFPILADALEDCRAAFHELRKTNLPILVEWSAQGTSTGWSKPGSSGNTGLVSTSTTYANTLDSSVSARSATSPGASCPVPYCGVGLSNDVLCKCYVHGFSDDGNVDGVFKFEGPTNTIEVTIPHGAGPAWADSGSNRLTLDSSKADDDATSGRNKIDCFLKSGSAGVSVYVYGYRVEMAFS